MSRSLKYFLSLFSLLIVFFVGEVSILSLQNKHIEEKKIFVSKVGLPDLAISTEAKYIRHRSLSDVFSMFNENPISISYFLTSFVYAPSNVVNITPNQIKVY
jgi:hypothetical protein